MRDRIRSGEANTPRPMTRPALAAFAQSNRRGRPASTDAVFWTRPRAWAAALLSCIMFWGAVGYGTATLLNVL